MLFYDSFDDFVADLEAKPEVKTRADKIREYLAKKERSNQEYQPIQVTKQLGRIVRIEKRCIGKNAGQLRKTLGVQRLSKEQLKHIPSVPLLDVGDPHDKPPKQSDDPARLWLFPHPDTQQDHLEVVVCDYLQICNEDVKLSFGDNLWSGHASSKAAKELDLITKDGWDQQALPCTEKEKQCHFRISLNLTRSGKLTRTSGALSEVRPMPKLPQ